MVHFQLPLLSVLYRMKVTFFLLYTHKASLHRFKLVIYLEWIPYESLITWFVLLSMFFPHYNYSIDPAFPH